MRSISVLSLSVSLSVFVAASGFAAGCVVTPTDADAGPGSPDSGPSTPGPDAGTPVDTPDSGRPQGPIVRTLVYHHLTAGENGGVDDSKGIAFSRDGTTGLFDENDSSGYRPSIVRSDGTGRRALDAVSAGWIDMTALSGDGTLAAYTTDAIFISSTATPARVTGPGVTQSRAWSRWAKDPGDPNKWRLYFPSAIAWGAPIQERGIYSAGSDGGSLESLMSPTQAAAVIGVPWSELAPKGGLRRGFDVSADGKRYVSIWSAGYCTQTGQKDYIVAASTDGTSAPRLLAGPITTGCGVSKLAISGDGTKVAYAVETGAGSSTRDLTVIDFEGSAKLDLAVYPGNLDTSWGLSDDGRVLIAGNRMHRTDGTGAFDLVVRGSFFSADPPSGIDNHLGALDGAGKRVFYVDAQSIPKRVALLEIDPSSTGDAPTITDPTVTPASIPLDGSESATISAKVAVAGGAKPVRVAASVLKDGARDDKVGEVVLFDDGTHGDATANDGVYTVNEIRATSGAIAGARTIRIRATFIDASTKAHSTVIEYTGLGVR
jgi:hypothetical protein